MSAPATVSDRHDCRDAFARTLEALAAEDPRIVAVCNDSVGSSKLGGFQKKFPDRLINVGIAEQDMVGIGAGLANGGKIPFVAAASCFLTGRALEQIKADVVYSAQNVKLCGFAPGIAYGELGPTHHSIEDLAWLRPLAGLTVIVPSDPRQTAAAVRFAVAHDGPVFLRISRMPVPELERRDPEFRVGRADVLREGTDAAIVACGTMVHRALEAADLLAARGVSARVVDMATIAPVDEEAIVAAAATGAVVTVEEASTRGGLGGAVAEVMATRAPEPAPMRILGFSGFQPTGSVEWLMERSHLTREGIAAAVGELVGARRR
jgi:transketolase